MTSLPELRDLIPGIIGAVYAYEGRIWLSPERIVDVVNVPDHGLVRCGLPIYELLDWDPNKGSWEVRRFDPRCPDTFPEEWLYDAA
jgi:hypothetical protein